MDRDALVGEFLMRGHCATALTIVSSAGWRRRRSRTCCSLLTHEEPFSRGCRSSITTAACRQLAPPWPDLSDMSDRIRGRRAAQRPPPFACLAQGPWATVAGEDHAIIREVARQQVLHRKRELLAVAARIEGRADVLAQQHIPGEQHPGQRVAHAAFGVPRRFDDPDRARGPVQSSATRERLDLRGADRLADEAQRYRGPAGSASRACARLSQPSALVRGTEVSNAHASKNGGDVRAVDRGYNVILAAARIDHRAQRRSMVTT